MAHPVVVPRWLAASFVCLASASAQAAIGGLITSAGSGTAPTADSFVQLSRCSHAGNQLCDQPVDFKVASRGRYRFDGSYAAGRYQVSVTSEGYLSTQAEPFEVTGAETHRVDIALQPMPVRHANPTACTAPDERGFCQVGFEIENLSGGDQDLDTWINVATTSPVPAGWSRYAAGDRAPSTRIRLAAGERRTVQQQVYIGRDLPSGAYATLELQVSPHARPDRALAYDFFPAVIVGARAAGAASKASLEAARQRHEARGANAVAGERDQAAGARTSVVVEVTDAASGEPLPSAARPKFRLMACDQPGDTYCRWIEGHEQDLPASGVMVVETQGMYPGRYQIQTRAEDNFAYIYSATFEVPLAEPMRITMPMAKMPIAVDDVATCEAVPLDRCVLEYRLRNTTDQPQQAALWLYNNMLTSESSVGGSVYTQGRQGRALARPLAVRLAPGESRTVRQPIGLQQVASGSSGWFQLYIADARNPADAKNFYRLGNYSVYQQGPTKKVTVTPFPDLGR